MMSVKEISEAISVFLMCSVKFGIAGMPMAVFLFNFGFWKAFFVCNIGGISGVVVFTYFLDIIKKWFSKIMLRFKKENTAPKKKFTFMNKLVVRTKRNFGLVGLAILTPGLLSIPLGIFLSLHFFKKHKTKIIIYNAISVVVWELVLYFSFTYFKSFFSTFFS
jgi:uncharacterized membrane protein